MPTSSASAVWEGVLRSGRGHFKAGSGAFEGDYSFATRFENARGTNPEELIAAAHAACLSMALSAGLEKAAPPLPGSAPKRRAPSTRRERGSKSRGCAWRSGARSRAWIRPGSLKQRKPPRTAAPFLPHYRATSRWNWTPSWNRSEPVVFCILYTKYFIREICGDRS